MGQIILFTGSPRSGTTYLSRILNLPHEVDSITSQVSWRELPRANLYTSVVHLVRDPLKTISSLQTISPDAFRIMGVQQKNNNLCLQCMEAWLKWNIECERVAGMRIRIEDVYSYVLASKFHRNHTDFTWKDLFAANPMIAKQIEKKAKQYGY